MRKRCYYDVLQIGLTATLCEIRHSYHKLAMKWHPDKNKSIAAKENFQEINEAYSILSTPSEKTFYDRHRETIIKNWNLGLVLEKAAESDNILTYNSQPSVFFVRPAYLGYDDSDSGFYTVYRNLFNVIKYSVEEMSDLVNNSEDQAAFNTDANLMILKAPSFGDSETKLAQVAEFYFYWENLPTLIEIAWENLCYSSLSSQQLAYSHEEKQKRKYLQKKLVEIIQNLVTYVKLHDPRYRQFIQNRFALLEMNSPKQSTTNKGTSFGATSSLPPQDIIQILNQNKIQGYPKEEKEVCLECWSWAKCNLRNILKSKSMNIAHTHKTACSKPQLTDQDSNGSLVLWKNYQQLKVRAPNIKKVKSEPRTIKYKSQQNKQSVLQDHLQNYLQDNQYEPHIRTEKNYQSPIKKRDIQIQRRKAKSLEVQNRSHQRSFLTKNKNNLLMITPK